MIEYGQTAQTPPLGPTNPNAPTIRGGRSTSSRTQELLQIGDKLFSDRFKLLTLWQTYGENFYPIRADFTREFRSTSEEFASFLMTGRPVLAHRELADQLGAILRPRNQDWLQASTGVEKIDNDKTCKQFLEYIGKVMRRVFYDKQSQFTRATKEGDKDYILFGQTVLEARLSRNQLGMLYRCWHLRDSVWAENADLEIDQFHRKWKVQRRALCKLFPNSVHPTIEKECTKDPFGEVKCRVIVLPSDEYDSYGKDERGNPRKVGAHPFVSIVIDEENQHIMEEVPQPDLGYVIPRWVTIGGFSQYAYSPTAMICLPDARMLQQMTLTLIEIGQKIVDPPMIAVGDAIQGGTNLYAGAMNWVDPDYDERTGEVLRPIALNASGLQWGTEYEEKIEKVINEAFYLNVLNLPPYEAGDKMTAFEVSERVKEYIRRATPLFEPMDVEYNGQLCSRTYETLERIGAFGSIWDRPPMLRGRQIIFKFTNPLVQAEDERKLTSFTRVSQLLGAAMQIDPTVRADFDVDTAFRDAAPGTGAPAKWMLDQEKADAIKQQARQQQAAQQQAQDLGNLGDHTAKMASAVEGVGKAASALQDAGIT
jgi:hypothetical protein